MAPFDAHAPQMSGRMARPPEARAASLVARWILVADRLALGVPTPLSRAAVAMAMHDALNAAEPRYARWLPPEADEPPAAGAPPLVAMSMAAFRVLASFHPVEGMRAEAEPLLREVLRTATPEALAAGVALGSAIGTAAATRRMVPVAFAPFPVSDEPGRWRPTPPFPLRGSVILNRPLLFESRDAARAAPPPALDSARYLEDAAEVRRLGAASSTERTAAQTEIAEFWAAQSGQRGFMGLLVKLLDANPPAGGVWDDARAVSMLAVALADSATLAWEEKYFHAHWRPITALRAGSPGVPADATWEPLLPTPPHPDFPSGHASDCAVGASLLAAAFGPDFGPVEYVALEPEEQPSRRFPTFDAIATECADSRVYAGAHFRFANDDGLRIGRLIAARAMTRVQPVR
jgi:hypothetical protein